MNRKEYRAMYTTNATLTDRQREQRAETFKNFDTKRRKLNVLGGILSAVTTLYVCKEYAHIDYTITLSDNDKITIAAVYMTCLIIWRFIRQKLSAATTPPDTYGAEERKAVEEMTPQQAKAYLNELDELQTAYSNGKSKGNTLFIILVIIAAVCMCYAIKKGVL